MAEPSEPYALKEEDLPVLLEEYDKLAAELLKRQKEGKGVNFFHFMIDLSGGPCVAKRLSGCGSGTEYLAVTPWGDFIPAISSWARKSSSWEMWMTESSGRISGMNSRPAMFMPRKSAGTALPSFTAAADVRQMPITLWAISTAPMDLGLRTPEKAYRMCDYDKSGTGRLE